ncbi:MAG: amidohydrolase [Chloroflexi bacterium]|nr:amidohydrolase [Chloroflexota bacterium]
MTPRPSLLLLNARVYSPEPGRAAPFGKLAATAVAIAGNRIAAVGMDDALRPLAGPGTRVIDCGGRALLPGLHDAHLHLFGHAARYGAVDCSPAAVGSIRDIQEALRRRCRELPPGAWVRAVGYDETALSEGRYPTRWELDAAAPDHPVRLQHRTYHACVLNSLALSLAGITIETPEPPGGLMGRAVPSGEPDGLLFETAQELGQRAVPPLPPTELAQGVARASGEYLRWGITALQDATASNTLADWRRMRRMQQEDHLHQRVTLMLGDHGLAEALEAGWGPGYTQGRLRLGAVKIILDESTGSVYPHPEVLKEQALLAHRAGFQVALHCLTLETLAAAVSAVEQAQAAHPRPDARHRIEHCGLCTPELASRLARAGIHVSTQPGFLYYGGARYLAQVPPEQLPWLYPLGTLEAAGVALAGGSDCPVAPANPVAGLYAAVTRRSETGELVSPEQRVSLERALGMVTLGAAAASLQEHELGRIVPGYLADLALLSQDPFAIAPEELPRLRSVLTVVDGRIAWEDL